MDIERMIGLPPSLQDVGPGSGDMVEESLKIFLTNRTRSVFLVKRMRSIVLLANRTRTPLVNMMRRIILTNRTTKIGRGTLLVLT